MCYNYAQWRMSDIIGKSHTVCFIGALFLYTNKKSYIYMQTATNTFFCCYEVPSMDETIIYKNKNSSAEYTDLYYL